MILCLTKPIRVAMDNKAFSFVEMVLAVGFSVLLLTGVYGFYTASSQSYSSGISGQNLQDGADIVISKIIEGGTESGVVYRLSTANSFMIPNGSANSLYTCGGVAQIAPCNANNLSGEIYYCFNAQTADSPCVGSSDPNARWYYLNSTGTSVIYHHPTTGGGTVEQVIYTAPPKTTMTLRFEPGSIPPTGSPLTCPSTTTAVPASPATPQVCTLPNVVEIDVALRQNLAAATVATNNRLSTTSGSGASSTFILLRDHP